jgi:hypothetical protein
MKLEELRQRLREPDSDPDRPKTAPREKNAAEAPPMGARCRSVVDPTVLVHACWCRKCGRRFDAHLSALDWSTDVCAKCTLKEDAGK